MGKPADLKDKQPPAPQPARWPFDPMQPGDHEPVRLPEAGRHETESKEHKEK